MDLKQTSGLIAEKLAGKYLKQKGFRILEERYRTRYGELDLICRKGKEVVFVEVRSIKSDSGFSPEESISLKKINHLIKSARDWIIKKRIKNLEIRFDLITVNLSTNPPVINHFPKAFESVIDL